MGQRNSSSFKNADAFLQPFEKQYFKFTLEKSEAIPVPQQISMSQIRMGTEPVTLPTAVLSTQKISSKHTTCFVMKYRPGSLPYRIVLSFDDFVTVGGLSYHP